MAISEFVPQFTVVSLIALVDDGEKLNEEAPEKG